MDSGKIIERVLSPIAATYTMRALSAVSGTSRFVFYVRHRNEPEETLDGPCELWNQLYEINCVGGTYEACVTLVDAVMAALQAMAGQRYTDEDGSVEVQRVLAQQESPVLMEEAVGLFRCPLRLELNLCVGGDAT